MSSTWTTQTSAGKQPAPPPTTAHWRRSGLPSPVAGSYLLISLAAFAMGLQANAIRFLNVPGISTTAFTATYVDLASGLASRGLTRPTARRLAGTVIGVAAGGFLGDWMLRHAHPYGPIVPAAVTAVVIVIAWMALKPRATPGLAR